MSLEEAAAFSQAPRFDERLRLPLWDDLAKFRGYEVSSLESYRAILVPHLSGQIGEKDL